MVMTAKPLFMLALLLVAPSHGARKKGADELKLDTDETHADTKEEAVPAEEVEMAEQAESDAEEEEEAREGDPEKENEKEAQLSYWDRLIGFLGNDAHEIDAKEAEAALVNKSKVLQEGETVDLAFEVGWKQILFTSSRIIFFKTALIEVWESYMSVPYSSILAFEVETGGMFPDMDSRFTIFTDIPGTPRMSATFLKGCADVFDVQKYLNGKVLGSQIAPESELKKYRNENLDYNETLITTLQGIWAWLGNDASEVDAKAVDETLRTREVPVLGEDDHVLLAYKIGRDFTLFTSKRLLLINVKALTGRKVEYKSVPYSCISAWSTQRAGAVLDADAELYIYTKIHGSFITPSDRIHPLVGASPRYRKGYSILGWNVFWQDFRKNRADIMDINALLSDKVLGTSEPALIEKSATQESSELEETWFWNHSFWYSSPPTPQGFEKMLRKHNNLILQSDEHVEQYYKNIRDSTIFTNKRVMKIDVMAISARKVKYTSLPYSSIRAFSFRAKTESLFLTKHGFTIAPKASLRIWTDMYPWRPSIVCVPVKKGDKKAPKKGTNKAKGSKLLEVSTEELDGFTAELLKEQEEEEEEENEESEQEEGEEEEEEEEDRSEEEAAKPKGKNKKKKKNNKRKGGDACVMTAFPRPGMSYQTFPLVGGFSKSADPKAVQTILNNHLFGAVSEPVEPIVTVVKRDSAWLSSLVSRMLGRSRQIDAKKAEETIRQIDPTILPSNEHAELAYQLQLGWSKDLTLLTSHRVLVVKCRFDIFGRLTFPMDFKSIPYKTVHGYAAETAGKSWWLFGDFDAKFDLWTTAPWMPKLTQILRKGFADIKQVNHFLTRKTLGHTPSSFLEGSWWWMAKQVEAKKVEKNLPQGILLDDEHVELAYKFWRDTFLFTTYRMMKIDIMKFTGQQRNYKSIPYSSIRAFSVDTAGAIDFDSEAGAWTDMPRMSFIGEDFRKDSDPLLILQEFSNKTLA